MDRSEFSGLLRDAIPGAWDEFIEQHATETPYAFAFIGGQCGNYIGYAVATEEGLRRTANKYADLVGQRHFPSFNDGSPVLKTV